MRKKDPNTPHSPNTSHTTDTERTTEGASDRMTDRAESTQQLSLPMQVTDVPDGAIHVAERPASSTEEPIPFGESSRTPRPNRSATALPSVFSAKAPGAPLPAVLPVEAVLAAYSNAQSGAKAWTPTNGALRFTYTKQEGATSLEVLPESPTPVDTAVIERLWRQVRAMSDLDGDVFLVLLASAIASSQTTEDGLWITASQILDSRGVRPIFKHDGPRGALRRAGHRQEDQRRIAECVNRMTSTWITINQMIVEEVQAAKRKRKRRKKFTLRSRLITVSDTLTQEDLLRPESEDDLLTADVAPPTTRLGTTTPPLTPPLAPHTSNDPWQESAEEDHLLAPLTTPSQRATVSATSVLDTQESLERDESITIAWRFRMGTWLKPFLDAPNTDVALLVRRALSYDPIRELWEKRLSRYFILHLRLLRLNGGQQAEMSVPVGNLLRDLSLPVSERHPQEAKSQFERALTQLVADQQISSWRYVSEPLLPPKGWLPLWLESYAIRVTAEPLNLDHLIIEGTAEESSESNWIQRTLLANVGAAPADPSGQFDEPSALSGESALLSETLYNREATLRALRAAHRDAERFEPPQ